MRAHRHVYSILLDIGQHFNEVVYSQVEAFYAQYPDPGTGAQARADSLDNIRNNIKWRARSEAEIVAWLQRFA